MGWFMTWEKPAQIPELELEKNRRKRAAERGPKERKAKLAAQRAELETCEK